MEKYNYFAGVDVSKDKLDVALLSKEGEVESVEVPNTVEDIEALFAKWAGSHEGFSTGSVLTCLETTGRYANPLLAALTAMGHDVWLQNALAIKRSMGLQRGKSDKVDAVRIAEYAFRFCDKVSIYKPASETITALKALTGARERLIGTRKRLTTELNESKRFDPESVHQIKARFCERTLAGLKEDLKALDQEIKQTVAKDKEVTRLMKVVNSTPGIGPVTTHALVIATQGFTLFGSARKMACYCGIAPFEHTSGSSIRGKTKVSKMAEKSIKSLLHMCALSAIQMEGDFKDYYERKVKEGKHKMAVLNAVKNKILHLVFALVRDDRIYEKKYSKKLA